MTPDSAAKGPAARPAPLRVLLSTRPERERAALTAGALALTGHALLALGLAVAGPLGGSWRPAFQGEEDDSDRAVTLLLPGTVPATRTPAAPARTTRPRRPAPVLTAPTDIPATVPPIAAPTATAAAAVSPAAVAEPVPMIRRFLPTYAAPLTPPAPEAMTDAARAEVRVRRTLGDVVDSIAAADEAHRRFRDWEVGKGSPWGFTPDGRPRLGGLPVPAPLKAELATAPGMRERARREQSNWTDLQHAAVRAETRAIVDDRIKAIRAQRERARADSAAAHPR